MNWGGISEYSYRPTRLVDPFGTWNLYPSSPPQSPAEPVTLARAKSYCRITEGIETDTEQDTDIGQMISVARSIAEFSQGRDLVRRQLELVYDYWPGPKIFLRSPLISVDGMDYKDSDGVVHPMLENIDYIVDGKKRVPFITPPYAKWWPAFTRWPSSAISIRVTTGFLPSDQWWTVDGSHVSQAMKYLIQHFFDQRDAMNRAIGDVQEWPYGITDLLRYGRIVSVE